MIQEAGRDLEQLAEFLELGREDLEAQLEPLRLSAEEGCLEYKQSLVNSVFRQLENERYRSLAATALEGLARELGVLIYITTVQRLLADGQLPLRQSQRSAESEERPEADEPQVEVKEIIAEIEDRVKKDPALRTRQPVKNILMQLNRYSKELNDFKELTARIPREKAPAVAANFRKTAAEIYGSIRRNYDEFVKEEQAALPKEPQNILLRIDRKSLVRIYAEQAREASSVRSSVLFSRDEQYGTRELLVELAGRHRDFDAMIRSERARYLELGGTQVVAREIALAFAAEITRRVEREVEYY
jgi:hypothetical protein